jgi:hypothetical protein
MSDTSQWLLSLYEATKKGKAKDEVSPEALAQVRAWAKQAKSKPAAKPAAKTKPKAKAKPVVQKIAKALGSPSPAESTDDSWEPSAVHAALRSHLEDHLKREPLVQGETSTPSVESLMGEIAKSIHAGVADHFAKVHGVTPDSGAARIDAHPSAEHPDSAAHGDTGSAPETHMTAFARGLKDVADADPEHRKTRVRTLLSKESLSPAEHAEYHAITGQHHPSAPDEVVQPQTSAAVSASGSVEAKVAKAAAEHGGEAAATAMADAIRTAVTSTTAPKEHPLAKHPSSSHYALVRLGTTDRKGDPVTAVTVKRQIQVHKPLGGEYAGTIEHNGERMHAVRFPSHDAATKFAGRFSNRVLSDADVDSGNTAHVASHHELVPVAPTSAKPSSAGSEAEKAPGVAPHNDLSDPLHPHNVMWALGHAAATMTAQAARGELPQELQGHPALDPRHPQHPLNRYFTALRQSKARKTPRPSRAKRISERISLSVMAADAETVTQPQHLRVEDIHTALHGHPVTVAHGRGGVRVVHGEDAGHVQTARVKLIRRGFRPGAIHMFAGRHQFKVGAPVRDESVTEARVPSLRSTDGKFRNLNHKGHVSASAGIPAKFKARVEKLGGTVRPQAGGGAVAMHFPTHEAALIARAALMKEGYRVTQDDRPGILYALSGGALSEAVVQSVGRPKVFTDDEMKTLYRAKSDKYEIGFDDWKKRHFSDLSAYIAAYQYVNDGVGGKLNPKDFPEDKVAAGVNVELEHTHDINRAMSTVMDHFAEHGDDYYEKLAKAIPEGKVDEDFSEVFTDSDDAEDVASDRAKESKTAMAVMACDGGDTFIVLPLDDALTRVDGDGTRYIHCAYGADGEEMDDFPDDDMQEGRHSVRSRLHGHLARNDMSLGYLERSKNARRGRKNRMKRGTIYAAKKRARKSTHRPS